MTRTYELGFVVEPRQNDDEVQAITDRFTAMIEEAGSEITYIDNWGKRKLAYPIRKFTEARYNFLYISATDGAVPEFTTVERLLQQDERVLRYLVVRTDEDLKRAYRKGKVFPEVPGMDEDELREFLGAPPADPSTKTEEPAAEEAAMCRQRRWMW